MGSLGSFVVRVCACMPFLKSYYIFPPRRSCGRHPSPRRGSPVAARRSPCSWRSPACWARPPRGGPPRGLKGKAFTRRMSPNSCENIRRESGGDIVGTTRADASVVHDVCKLPPSLHRFKSVSSRLASAQLLPARASTGLHRTCSSLLVAPHAQAA